MGFICCAQVKYIAPKGGTLYAEALNEAIQIPLFLVHLYKGNRGRRHGKAGGIRT